MSNTLSSMMRKKPIQPERTQLEPTIGLFQLTMLGVGATIGTGIFVVLNDVVPEAGPAVIFAFIIAAITAALTALAYAEMASCIPASGSSYSYAYATLGEYLAYLVAWCLLLEYGVSAAAIAVGSGEYLNKFLEITLGFKFPDSLSNVPAMGGVMNLPSMIIVALCCILLLRGSKESTVVNTIMVVVKLLILCMFIAIAITAYHSDNMKPFAPHGYGGVWIATATVFFSFIGIDAISTAGEEVKNPKRNLPLAIILALCIVTGFYILISLTAIGAQPAAEFEGQKAGLAQILQNITGSAWPATIFAFGAVISTFSVILIVLYGQTRILYAMGRDGMIPTFFERLNPKSTPVNNILLVCIAVMLASGFTPADVLFDLTSIGTLVAFSAVSIGVIILRNTHPELPRSFKAPFYPLTPILAIASCMYVLSGLPPITFFYFAIWIGIATVTYFAFSIRHSRLNEVSITGVVRYPVEKE
ncbi:MAG: amino acid permease [Thiofilum sp.]|uniref:APC family permease n=1 Tax=Thiofilum sp. TaxID=2212733 RepID=UPI0025D15F0F|nr:amino acid permease [Thiofilum sp.]MBK8454298.1 amino acid permease [Thiofilum sp.]